MLDEKLLQSISNKHDRREIRNFQRFLRVWPRFKSRMIQSPHWRKYLGLPPNPGNGDTSGGVEKKGSCT